MNIVCRAIDDRLSLSQIDGYLLFISIIQTIKTSEIIAELEWKHLPIASLCFGVNNRHGESGFGKEKGQIKQLGFNHLSQDYK
jgi:hypothetical protein